MVNKEQISLFPLQTEQGGDLTEPRQLYLHLTKSVLPTTAREAGRNWPVCEDHCFQRIVLDHVCKGVWYDYLKKPAYKHMTAEQLDAAISLCVDIANEKLDLHSLNRQSLNWREKL